MTGHLAKRSVTLSGHRTSIALEPAFLDALDRIAAGRSIAFAQLVALVDRTRDPAIPLASALRVLALHEAGRTGDHSIGTSKSSTGADGADGAAGRADAS